MSILKAHHPGDSRPFWFFDRSSEFASINSHKCIRDINSDFSEGSQEDLDPSRVTDVRSEDLGYGIWGNSLLLTESFL